MNETIFTRKNSDESVWTSVVFSPNRPLNQYGMYFQNPSVNPGSGTWYETKERAIAEANQVFERMEEGYKK